MVHDHLESLTGHWKIEDGKSYAECEKCGWYETTLMAKNNSN